MGIISFLKRLDSIATSETFSKKNYNDYNFYNNSSESKEENTLENRQNMYDELYKLEQQYSEILQKHYELSEKIGFQYTIAINQNNIINKETEKCIDLCNDDIALASTLSNYYKQEATIRHQEINMAIYSSFKTLAMIYEKKEDYLSSIFTCIQSIKLGFLRDGTTGGMQGRLAKLIKKYNSKHNSDIAFDYEKNVLYDNRTGEVIENNK